ncbi:MAG: thermonuclease family protein [Elusimicrobia bacterium]|nr:thermonuclease family protein [Elusimicrobiota bacterium]
MEQTAGYGESVLESMAKQLNIDRTTLVRCVQFYLAYPKGVPETNLTWSHVRELLALPGPKERNFYQREAEKHQWTRDELVKAIQADHIALSHFESTAKKVKQLARPEGGPYIYRVTILKVIDGDTFDVNIDLGFKTHIEETVRLAAIDAPRLNEDGGDEAFQFVRDQMAKAKTIVVRTGKEDRHGRYVMHVFYSLEDDADKEQVFQHGRWLNQEMLDRGLARVY